MIKFLLKNKGMTITGAKKIMDININKLDANNDDGLKADYKNIFLKTKSKLILEKLRKIKRHGKKDSS